MLEFFGKHKDFKKYFFNTGWLFSEKILQLIAALFVGIYVARYLGPDRYGVLQFSISFVALFSAFARLGLDEIIVKNAVQSTATKEILLGTAFCLRLIGWLILLCIIFVSIQLTSITFQTKCLIMVIALGYAFESFRVIEFYFHSQVQGRLASTAGIIALLASSVIKLTLVWLGVSLVWFAWIIVVEQCIKAIVLFVLYVKNKSSLFHWRFGIIQAKKLLKESWPFIFSSFVIMIYLRIDQIMIKLMVDSEGVGNYAAAVNLSEFWYFVPIIMTQSFFPMILHAKEVSESFYIKKLYQLYVLLVWGAISVAIFMSFSGDWIIHFLYGPEYGRAGRVLSIHIWAGVFVALGVVKSKFMLIENIQWLAPIYSTMGAVINIAVNYILIKLMNIEGAAVSTLISQVCVTFLFPMFHNKDRQSSKMFIKALLFRS